MDIRSIYEKWTSISLILRIVAGLAIGTVLALAIPGLPEISVLGDVFVGALKGIAPILVFILVMSSLACSGAGLGSRFRLVLSLYIGTTLIAASVATVFTYAFPVTVSFTGEPESFEATTDVVVFLTDMLKSMVTNPITAIINGNFISILFWAALTGIIMKSVLSDNAKNLVKETSDVVVKVVSVIIQFAPFGIMGLIYNTVSTNGLDVFVEYGQLIILLVAAMLTVMFVTNPAIAAVFLRKNPYPLLFRCLKDGGVPAFFTRSSAACIPMNMQLCEDLGIEREFYSVSIPLGATINMNGAAVTISVMSLVAAFSLGIEIPISLALMLCMLSAVAACGASGVSGGSLLLIPMCCSLLGVGPDIAAEMIGIGFIIGVIQDSLETMLNVSMDGYFTSVAEVSYRKKKGIDRELRI